MRRIKLFGLRRLLRFRSVIWEKVSKRGGKSDEMRVFRPAAMRARRWRRRYSS